MRWESLVTVVLVGAVTRSSGASTGDYSEEAAVRYITEYNREAGRWATELAHVEWDYDTNLSEQNKEKKVKSNVEYSKWLKKSWQETIKFPWESFKNETLKRQFKRASQLGTSALPNDKLEKFEKILSEMQAIYSTAKICDYHDKNKCDLSLDPEISEILAKSQDTEELKHVWLEWRKATGRKAKNLFQQYAEYCIEAAKLNNITDFSDYWNEDFESDTFKENVLKLWTQVEPLYQQFHAYVRRKLYEKYGENVLSKTGPIPAHLLGDMWGQSWDHLYSIAAPFPNRKDLDITEEMKKQNYTVHKMFKLSEDFFTSLNFSALPELFWKNSIFEKIQGQDMVCHASAWDFFDGKDFRIKMCTVVNMEDLFTIHHEMGHIQYYMEYRHQPVEFRQGANSGFHEAVGDLIFLSASTRKNLYRLGLLKGEEVYDDEQKINTLFQRGLEKIAFLPFGLLVDLFRWNVFKGVTTPATYNQDWWFLKVKYQGIEPPSDRDELDFDPGAKYHVLGNVPYIRYFVSYIIQFQFHRALCIEAGQFDPNDPNSLPLHECNIYNSTKAGNLLRKMLQMGSSRPWPDAMEVITGQRSMDGQAILQFFQPLYDWLKQENERTGEKIGWDCSKRIALPNKVGPSGGAPSTATLSSFLFSSLLCIVVYNYFK